MKQMTFSVGSLTLDESNPRHANKTASLQESIDALLRDTPDKLIKLARDIAKNGLNPTELPIVVIEGGKPIVLEGNRRLAAVKLLRNPNLASDEKHRRQLVAIARGVELPRRVTCIVVENRLQASHWIKLRHTGENGGVGVLRWNPVEVGRFTGRSNSTDRAGLLIDAIAKWFPDDQELLANARRVRGGRITNLARMIADPVVRNALGIEFKDDNFLSHYPLIKIHSAYVKLFSDLAGDVSVDQIKTKSLREEYLKAIHAVLPSLPDKLKVPERYSKDPSELVANDEPAGSGGGDVSQKEQRGTWQGYERKLFQGVSLRNVSIRTSEVLEEAQRLKIDEFPNLAAIMARVVVDIALTDAAEQLGWKRNQESLKDRIVAVLNQVDPQKNDPALRNAWQLSQWEDGALVLKTLHAFVHSWESGPLATEVRRLSAVYGPLLCKIDELLEEKRR
ncbi:hypothetical protein HUT11_25835 [Streptomyces seoulensis]|nr:hypothetical protein HUT11_25835 [Streptomyces seoulensis]